MIVTDAKDEQKLEAKIDPNSTVERKQAPAAIEQPAMSDKARQQLRSFAELQERADAVDKVMTQNGPPELDLNSGWFTTFSGAP